MRIATVNYNDAPIDPEMMGTTTPSAMAEAEYAGDDLCLTDSEAFSAVIQVLEGVRMAPALIAQSDRDHYEDLLSIIDPGKRMNPDEEALLVTAAKALSGAASKIDTEYHGSLLNNIFNMSLWNYGCDTRSALLELITTLAVLPDKFLDGCLLMLVNNFLPPKRLRESSSHSHWLTKRKKEVHSQLQMALHYIGELVPLAPMKLRDIIDKGMPKYTQTKNEIVWFVECMLGLETTEIGEFLRSMLLAKVVDLLTDLDVNISLEDIMQEEHNKGIFEMEMDDWKENADNNNNFKHQEENNGVIKGNLFADKLDSLMVVMCEHLKACADGGQLLKVFETLSEIFRRAIMKLHKSKFSQFAMFYACSLDPDICGEKFAILLTDIFVSESEDPHSRMKAVAYLASYLARAKFVSSFVVVSILTRLVAWCFDYCKVQNSRDKKLNPVVHQVYYSGCQAVMYILCFRMRLIMDVPQLKPALLQMPLDSILRHPLDPLKVCLPSIVQEFLQQANAARLFCRSVPYFYDNLLESEFSKAFGGAERLDMFFPFDPYLLKESDRFMRPNFKFWSMVKTTYGNWDSEDEQEYEDDDLDIPDFANNAVGLEDPQDDLDIDSEEELEYSINNMSITPKPIIRHELSADFHDPSRMPARIRPSVSPPT